MRGRRAGEHRRPQRGWMELACADMRPVWR
jgi:hypothetical protein